MREGELALITPLTGLNKKKTKKKTDPYFVCLWRETHLAHVPSGTRAGGDVSFCRHLGDEISRLLREWRVTGGRVCTPASWSRYAGKQRGARHSFEERQQ